MNLHAQVEVRHEGGNLVRANEIPQVTEADIEIDVGDLIRSNLLEGEPLPEEPLLPEAPTSPFARFEQLLGTQNTQSQQQKARVRILTFSTNALDDRTLTVDTPYMFEDVQIVLRGCRANVENIPNNDMAWIDVFTTLTDAAIVDAEPVQQLLLSGWILSQYTDANTLEHPKYDVRLMGCQA